MIKSTSMLVSLAGVQAVACSSCPGVVHVLSSDQKHPTDALSTISKHILLLTHLSTGFNMLCAIWSTCVEALHSPNQFRHRTLPVADDEHVMNMVFGSLCFKSWR